MKAHITGLEPDTEYVLRWVQSPTEAESIDLAIAILENQRTALDAAILELLKVKHSQR